MGEEAVVRDAGEPDAAPPSPDAHVPPARSAADPPPRADHDPGVRVRGVDGDRAWDHHADRWLVDRVRAGSGEAFEVLLRRHQDRIFRIGLRMLGSREDAEDVTQDVAVQLWRALASFSGASLFTTWLYRVVVNRCLNHQRQRRETRPLLDADHPSVTGPEDRVIGAAHIEATAAAIAALPAEQRGAFVLGQVEGLSYREVAAILDISVPAVRSRLERARKGLLHALRDWT